MLIIRTGKIGEKDGTDITVKTSRDIGKFFAPTWQLVGGHKKWYAQQMGEQPPAWTLKFRALSDEQYTAAYKELLRGRWKRYAPELKSWLQVKSVVTLLCYCDEGKFCHRDIAAQVLLQIARYWGIEARIE